MLHFNVNKCLSQSLDELENWGILPKVSPLCLQHKRNILEYMSPGGKRTLDREGTGQAYLLLPIF